MGTRRALTIEDRTEISTGLKAGWSITMIADGLGSGPSTPTQS